MNGFLLIDKPVGSNSFKLVIALRKMLGQRRIGYAGTLDPLASGLMILAIGEYTKLLPYLEAKDKVYEVTVLLGQVSNTYDTDGEMSTVEVKDIPEKNRIEQVLAESFTGEIQQIPPKFSAIQIDGKRAYDLARKGHEFELKSRPVQIFSSKLLDYIYPELRLEVHCSSGTYIRTIAHDLGQKLGTGGLVSQLRRTRIGDIDVAGALPLASLNVDFVNKNLVPPRTIFKNRSMVDLSESQYSVLTLGNFIDNVFNLQGDALGFFKEEVVGVIELTENGSKLKFKKKLHIF